MKLTPYLMMNGNCEEAIKYYQEIFGAKTITIMRYKEAHRMAKMEVDKDDMEKIMHSVIQIGESIIYLSDIVKGQSRLETGNINMTIEFEQYEQQLEVYNKLLEGGSAIMPLQDMFWGASFAKVIDKYGIIWLLEFTKIQQ